ncbi:MAG TPA: helix-turn-helix domain-containing protein [Streptomyces sp.]|nr:helix-turn-helix domain-containing protein [Streptomyces sp.]HWU12091.1 helix-turn-helix domain-containing protein [Streptomyces sp.]
MMLHVPGDDSIAELAELFSVSRSTVYRVLERTQRTELGAGHRQGSLT